MDWAQSTLVAAPTNELIHEDKLGKTRDRDSIRPLETYLDVISPTQIPTAERRPNL